MVQFSVERVIPDIHVHVCRTGAGILQFRVLSKSILLFETILTPKIPINWTDIT